MEPLLWILLVMLGLGGVALKYYLSHRRRSELALFAAAHRLEYSRRDPFDSLSLPFPLLRKGDGRGVESTMWGEWNGEPLRAFDYWYYTKSSSSEGGTSRTYHRFSCALLEVPAHLPDLHVAPEGVWSRLADAVGFRDLEFESEEFNRRFQVQAAIREFAYELVDARMMSWLLALPRPYSLDVSGPNVLVSSARLRPAELVAFLGAATSFRRRIPRVVWSRYGVEAR